MSRRALEDTIVHLRGQLQACQSRTRLALQALHWLRERLLVVGRDAMTIEHMSELTLRLDNIEALLAGEEVGHG
jgi:hypothetical protein